MVSRALLGCFAGGCLQLAAVSRRRPTKKGRPWLVRRDVGARESSARQQAVIRSGSWGRSQGSVRGLGGGGAALRCDPSLSYLDFISFRIKRRVVGSGSRGSPQGMWA